MVLLFKIKARFKKNKTKIAIECVSWEWCAVHHWVQSLPLLLKVNWSRDPVVTAESSLHQLKCNTFAISLYMYKPLKKRKCFHFHFFIAIFCLWKNTVSRNHRVNQCFFFNWWRWFDIVLCDITMVEDVLLLSLRHWLKPFSVQAATFNMAL